MATAAMQRNEVDALTGSTMLGIGTPELWQRLSHELDGRTTLEKPHVSKKVLVKAIRMQTEAMRFLVDEIDRVRDKMSEMERETKNSQRQFERVNTKLLTLQGQFDESVGKVDALEMQQREQGDSLARIDDVAEQTTVNRDAISQLTAALDASNADRANLAQQVEQDLVILRHDQEITKQFALQLEDRMNAEEKELFLTSDHIIHNQLSLERWMNEKDQDGKRKDDAIREFTDKLNKQARNVQEMMLEARRTLDDNTCAVEDVQRMLLLKADRTKMDEMIETKYEEICNQVDKALAAVVGEEDEFKRVSQELQSLVTHLSESKADKKDLLEVKEQVLYDSRVRQQVENLRAFIDLKMNRDDVFSALKNKADKDEMVALLRTLSEGMNASIQKAQRSFAEADSAFLTSKSALGSSASSGGKRGATMLPSIEKERCLSCNSALRDAPGAQHTHQNKNAYPMTAVYGGGFQAKTTTIPAIGNNNHGSDINGGGGSRAAASSGTPGRGGLSESASEGFLLGVDGHVYQGDPDLVAMQMQESRTPSKGSSSHRQIPPVAAQRRAQALQHLDERESSSYEADDDP